MKIRHLLIGLFAVAATVACKPEEVVETPKLDVDKSAVSLAATAGEASFNVTSNKDWTASADADWVSLQPASGKGSDKAVSVKVTADDNASEEPRTAKITVKAGDLTKTVSVSQTGATGTEPEPGPEPVEDTYILVGEAIGGWDVDANGITLTLADGYYVAKEVGITANKPMHFTKNNKWEGNVKGLHGLIAPNEIGEVGNNDISLTEGGAFDVYLTEALDKFYFMSPGKLPSEAVEHVDIQVSWGMMGMFVGNEWGTDVPMTYEGEWIVAKGAQFSNLTFKIRGNGNWTDATNIGMAPGSEKGVVNGKISVVTAEYSKANLGGDAADIKLNGEAGTYDVYFSFENLEVYVMEQGYKPGEKEPQNPEPVDVTYTVVGTLDNINWNNAAPEGLMTLDGNYYVARNVPFVTAATLYGGADQIEFKIVETGTWDGYGVAAGTAAQSANAEIALIAGGDNIPVAAAGGSYDVYFDKANAKVWVMNAGLKPGDTPAPDPGTDEAEVKTIFEGPFDASWDTPMNALSYDGYDWSTVNVGDVIKIYGHPTSSSDGWYGMNFRTGEGWTAFTEVPDQFNTPTTVAVKVTQITYDELVAKHGFVVVGTGYTVDKVELIPAALEATSFEDLLSGAGTFEGQDISMLGCWGENAPSIALSAAGEGYGGGYALVLKNPVDGGQYNSWKAQAALDFPEPFDPSKTYVMSFYVKASTNATIGVQYQNASYSNQGGNMSFTALTDWVYVEHEFTTGSFDDIIRLIFNFGENAADFYIDNFKFGPKK